MVNSGAIVVTSLIKRDWHIADRFDYVSNLISNSISFPRVFLH